jgi:hypothetical protein
MRERDGLRSRVGGRSQLVHCERRLDACQALAFGG